MGECYVKFTRYIHGPGPGSMTSRFTFAYTITTAVLLCGDANVLRATAYAHL